ncbi:protein dachsous-like [Clytia hemisphaerica]|uniref:Cadherin domain-containing protein n=1 Tax=Clytia hemisphaerica TaxID=252671 RepID=A0A7M5XF53_9CNID
MNYTSPYRVLLACLVILLQVSTSLAIPKVEQYTFHVDEGLPKNTVVGQVRHPKKYTKPKYQFVNPVSQSNFALTSSGVITTRRTFDHEKLTQTQKREGYKLFLSRIGTFDFITVTVYIEDVNDNRPRFPVKSWHVFVPEDANHSDDITFPNAHDPDTKQQVIYRVESGNTDNAFEVRKIDNKPNYGLALTEGHELDVDFRKDSFNLTISACEKISKLCSYLKVDITVTDVNDNSPIFDKSLPTSFEIYENVSLSVPIFQVKVSDADSGKNGEVEFEMFNQNDFRIDKTSGEIFVATNKLDAETKDVISFLIIVNDRGAKPRKSTYYLVAKVLDCNDEAPTLEFHPRSVGSDNLIEGMPIGTTIGSLTAVDKDLTQANNEIVSIGLAKGEDFFKLEQTKDEVLNGVATKKYFIKTMKEIDREVTPSINISISATDSGSPPLTSTVDYTVNVIDKNDNNPIFEKQIYETELNETAKLGSFVLQVKASDLDAGINSRISYSITSKHDHRWFYIEESTGRIMLNDYVDREKTDSVEIQVSARDHGISPLTNKAIVKVKILDANDNDPYFVVSNMNFTLEENNKVNKFIGKMEVSDPDIIGSNALTCYIDHPDFRVQPSTCEIYANKKFDRERKSHYALSAIVKDGLGRSSTGRVLIQILDQNDNMPKFDSKFFNISVHTNFPTNKNAAFLKAHDPDATDSSQFSATIDAKDDFFFDIEIYTGGIKLLNNLTKTRKTKFLFTAYVTDRKNPQPETADSARVQLNVLPPSTQPPIFEKARYEFQLDENNENGADVGKVKAMRPISYSELFIEYNIKSGNIKDTFSIGDFGVLKANRLIDYEEYSRFDLIIEAVDSLHPTRVSNITRVVINIRDLNDNTPRFINQNNVVAANEGVGVGHLLYTCVTEDLDSGINGEVTYRIKHTTGHFQIHPTRGEVRTNGSLDFETSEGHVIYVEATDRGTPSRSAQFKIEVKVRDMNDNQPLFFNSSQIVSVRENNPPNQLILTLNASDADVGNNGQFFFRLLPNEDSKSFRMSRNGNLYVTKSLDRETKSTYSLKARVQDLGIPPQHSEAAITINVDDLNDESPKFEKLHYNFEVSEELQPGTVVGEIIAVDADTGENGKFTYYLLNQHKDKDKFEIETRQSYGNNRHVCVIKTKKKFDSEEDKGSYNITIGASDHGMNGNSNEVDVTIVIRNINDHPPEFMRNSPYVACINIGTKSNEKVLQVTATDKDKEKVPLIYSLIAMFESHNAALHIFTIDQSTGVISTSVEISGAIARIPVYEMVVRVQEDEHSRLYTNYQKVVIFVSPKPEGQLFKELCPHITIKSSSRKEHIVKEQWKLNLLSFDDLQYQLTTTQPNRDIPFQILTTTGIIKVTSNHHKVSFYQLNVTVSATDQATAIRFTEWIILNVYIVPKNMYPPSYPKNPETYRVEENYPVNKPISVLKTPQDRDRGMEGKCIFSIEDSVNAPVKVSPLTGEIVFTEPIDREKHDKIVVKIRVSDLAEELPYRLSNTLTAAIHIIDVNDCPPKFDSKAEVKVREDERVGVIVSHVHAVDPDAGDTKTNIEYAIVSGNIENTFQLNRKTGELKTSKTLSINKRQTYNLMIMAMEKRDSSSNIKSLNSTFDLKVRLLDVNDQKPRFVKTEFQAKVRENQPIGTEVVQLQSIDDDLLPEYKEVTYKILEKNSGFYIDSKSGMIRTSIPLDRENWDKYTLDVLVRNVAPPHGEDTCKVIITIDDVNDSPPIFTGGAHQEIHILENSLPVPRSIHRLRHTDADDVKNSRVTFQIVNFVKPSKVIRLDSKTGELWLNEKLDREERSEYVLTVEAKNIESPYHKAQQNISVIVDDVDDEDPIFEKKIYLKTVSETQKVDASASPVLNVKAVDKDTPKNAFVKYALVNPSRDVADHFEVDVEKGAIYLIKSLDYEQQRSYTFKVKAEGKKVDSFDQTTVQIQVQDENDNKPVFTQSVYNFSLPEIKVGAVIGTVRATDRDQDGQQQVRYRFDPPDWNFQINPETGEVHLMDGEITRGQYRLHVVAMDVGLWFKLSNWAEILVTVGPSDDKVLKFLSSSVVFPLDENPQNGIRLGKVVAVSENTENVIRYKIKPRSNPDSAFRIDEEKGDIYVNNSAAVDYEKRANFFLAVLATIEDSNVERFLHVLVNLTDVNDNDPQILEKNKTFNIPETDFHPFVHPKLIYTFHVRDDDKIDQNRIKLQIISGNEDGLFYIGPRYQMYLVKEMDYEKKSKHNLVVRVTDGGNPYRYADSYINFNVEDLNDNKPILDKMQPVFISEAAKVDTLVTQVHAVDNDKTKTDIKYSIETKGSSPNTSMFSIDEYSGKIFLQHTLDYETNHSFKLRICAFDGVHRTYRDLQINVEDVNDHSPRFSKSIYTVKNVYTPLRKNQFIIKVDATDPDQGEFGFVQYKLGTALDPFTIEQDTGKIYANKPFQLTPGIAKLTVIAYDSKNGQGSRSSTALVEIHVSQLHQPNPYFKQSTYRFSIEEHTPDGVPIGHVEATVQNGYKEFNYRIAEGNFGGVFTMEKGQITTYKNLDRETKAHYTLTIVAEVISISRDKSPLTASCTVHIEIKDINDNQPVFEKQAYHVTQKEDVTVGTKLLQVKATDADDPRQANGKLVYSIHSGQEATEWLRINETDGWIETREELDRETTDTIQLTIRVADIEGAGMEAFTSLNVTVLDVNDNEPSFNYDLIRFNVIKIKENMPPHSVVFRAGATDKDIGENGRVSYRILESGGRDYFYMNESIPGWVYTKRSLDYEKNSSYTLRVLAYDHGKPSQQASVDFEIAVEDVNEFKPLFNEKRYSFEMYGDMEIGSVIGNVSATDKDGGSAGQIYYSIHPPSIDKFRIHINTGIIVVNKDLRRRQKITNSLEVEGKTNDDKEIDDNKKRRRRRSLNSVDETETSGDDLQDIRFQVRADNGPNTTAVTTDIVVRVNYTCPGCVIYTLEPDTADMKGTTTTVVVVASIAVFLMIIFITCMAYFLRKKGCFNRENHAAGGFCNTKKETGLSNSVERELLNSGASSFDRLQHFYNGEHPAEKSQVSSETGLLPDGSGTGRSVSAADKASTYSFGVYHEQGKTDSEMHRLPDTLSEITMIKELEDDSVFGYSSGKMKSEPTKSLISRSTQESSLYSLNSNVHRNGFNFVPRQSNKMISTNRSDSHESLKDFMEEGGGEAAGGLDVSNLLYAKLAEVNEDERDAIMESVRPFREEGPLSYGGSFSTIIGSDEDLRRAYNNPYNKYNWKPPYQNSGTNSVFSEIGRKIGGRPSMNRPSNYSYSQKDVIANNAAAKQPLLHDITPMNNRIHYPAKHTIPGSVGKVPPHQATAPPIDIPLQVLNSGRTSMLSSVTSLPRLPQELQSTYTSGILSPNFTPALTPLVFRSPSVSSIGTQEEFNTQNNNKQMTNNFNPGFNSNLHRSDSRVSQLSRITLSDLEISDAEIGV